MRGDTTRPAARGAVPPSLSRLIDLAADDQFFLGQLRINWVLAYPG
jgi:hypothetical protein